VHIEMPVAATPKIMLASGRRFSCHISRFNFAAHGGEIYEKTHIIVGDPSIAFSSETLPLRGVNVSQHECALHTYR
jgi:hypothetical protein